jgi:hypothetical protein
MRSFSRTAAAAAAAEDDHAKIRRKHLFILGTTKRVMMKELFN